MQADTVTVTGTSIPDLPVRRVALLNVTPMAGDDDVAVIMKQRTRIRLGVDDSQFLPLLAVCYAPDTAATEYWQPECAKTGWHQPSGFGMFPGRYYWHVWAFHESSCS
jgi:hypothetical protein